MLCKISNFVLLLQEKYCHCLCYQTKVLFLRSRYLSGCTFLWQGITSSNFKKSQQFTKNVFNFGIVRVQKYSHTVKIDQVTVNSTALSFKLSIVTCIIMQNCEVTNLSVFLQVMDKLRVLFTGYSSFPPTCFILCGNFLSSPLGTNHAKVLKGRCFFLSLHICIIFMKYVLLF